MSTTIFANIELSTVLGAIGTLYGAYKTYKNKKAVTQKKEIIKSFAQNSCILKDFLVKNKQILGDICQRIDDHRNSKSTRQQDIKFLKDFFMLFENFTQQYDVLPETFLKLYKSLLKNESVFSLSYGFDRYINALRLFTTVHRKEYEQLKVDYLELKDTFFTLRKKPGSLTDDEMDELMGDVDKILKDFQALFKNAEELEPFITELCLKYDTQDEDKKSKNIYSKVEEYLGYLFE